MAHRVITPKKINLVPIGNNMSENIIMKANLLPIETLDLYDI